MAKKAVLGIQYIIWVLPDDELYPKVVCSSRLMSDEQFRHLLCIWLADTFISDAAMLSYGMNSVNFYFG